MKYAINAAHVPDPKGFYSQGTSAGRMIFISGQTGMDACIHSEANTQVHPQAEAQPSLIQQTERCIDLIEKLLEELQCSLSDVANLQVLLTSIDQMPQVDYVLARRFDTPAPARSVAEVQALPEGAAIEIAAIACR